MAAYPVIAAVGAGRMGRGIAIVFAYAGHDVRLIDAKTRDAKSFRALCKSADEEIRTTLAQLADFQMIQQANCIPKTISAPGRMPEMNRSEIGRFIKKP